MKRPLVRPLLGATAGIVLCAGSAAAAAKPTAEPPAPPPPAKPGWVERVAAAPKKLAFWDKDKPAAPAPAPAAAPATAKKQTSAAKSKKPAAAAPAAPRPAAAPVKKGAAAPPPAPAEPAPARKSFLSKLPALPFMTKPDAAPAPAAADPASISSTSRKKGSVEARGSVPPPADDGRPPADAPAEPEKKAGFFEFGRLWPAGKKPSAEEAPATVAQSKSAPARPRPAATSQPAAVPGAAAEEEKPSLWARMTAAITPSSPSAEKPQTTPVPKGLAPLGATAPGSNTFVITKDDSAFFSFGPQQATPPDAYLATGTIVTLTGKNWGWASVQLPDGRVGVVDRAALRPALVSDLIPSQRPGDALMASLSPDKIKGKATPNFILPAAEMPDLPTSGDAGGPGNPLLLPFSPDDITDPGQFPPLPEIQPLPEPPAAPDSESTAPDPAAPSASEPAPEPAVPALPSEDPASPESPATASGSPAE